MLSKPSEPDQGDSEVNATRATHRVKVPVGDRQIARWQGCNCCAARRTGSARPSAPAACAPLTKTASLDGASRATASIACVPRAAWHQRPPAETPERSQQPPYSPPAQCVAGAGIRGQEGKQGSGRVQHAAPDDAARL
jgi:hypothetical protein